MSFVDGCIEDVEPNVKVSDHIYYKLKVVNGAHGETLYCCTRQDESLVCWPDKSEYLKIFF